MKTAASWSERCLPNAPLLFKELRVRMRARTVVVTGNLYVLALCAVVLFSLLLVGNLGEAPGWEIGRSLYRFLVYTQSLLMLFVAPLVAASAIAEEKEQKTYDTLRMTPAEPGQIVTAKLAAALGCFLMLIMVSLPMASISFILGGVAPVELAKTYTYTLLSTLAVGAMGLYWSTRFERTIAAIPAASICVVLVLVSALMVSETNSKAVASISPIVFYNTVFGEGEVPFFGDGCPVWIPCFLFLGLIFAYYVAAATTRLRFQRERRHVLTRCLALALFFLLALFVVGEHTAPVQRAAEARETICAALVVLMALLFACAPWLGANRRVEESEDPSITTTVTWWLRRFVVSGPGFVFILWVVTLPLVWLALQTVDSPRVPIRHTWWVHAGVTGPAVMVWTLLSGVLAGRTSTVRRFVGMAVTYVIMFAVTIGPLIVLGVSSMAGQDKVPVWVQCLALVSPATSVLAVVADPQGMQANLKDVMGALGADGFLLTIAAIYLVVAAGLALIWFRQRRRTTGAQTVVQ